MSYVQHWTALFANKLIYIKLLEKFRIHEVFTEKHSR